MSVAGTVLYLLCVCPNMYQTPRSKGTRIYHPTLRTGPCKQPIHKAQNLRNNSFKFSNFGGWHERIEMGAKITEIHEPHPRSCLCSWARKEEPELSSWASLTGSTCHWIGSVSAFSLKVTSGGSILWADSKVICCFLIETAKYYVYLVVFARNTEFCWKNKFFDFLKT